MWAVQYLFDSFTDGRRLPWQAYMVVGLLIPPVLVLARRRSAEWMLLRAATAGVVTWFLYYQTIDRYWYTRMRDLPLAATDEEMMAASADGAPKLFALLCGWLPVGIYVACWIGLWLLLFHFRKRKVSPP